MRNRRSPQQRWQLTAREMDVLRLIAKGSSNREIMDALYISEPTVKNHVARICDKLGANNRTHALVVALGQGLVSITEVSHDG
jgi:DNA-binding CsgD family transcriptional regulator